MNPTDIKMPHNPPEVVLEKGHTRRWVVKQPRVSAVRVEDLVVVSAPGESTASAFSFSSAASASSSSSADSDPNTSASTTDTEAAVAPGSAQEHHVYLPLDDEQMKLTDTVKLTDLRNCKVTLNGKSKIILVDNCHDVELVMMESVICGIEAVNSTKCRIHAHKRIPSVSIDKTTGFHVTVEEAALPPEENDFQIVHCNAEGLSVGIAKGLPSMPVVPPEGTDPRRQCITRLIQPASGSGSGTSNGSGSPLEDWTIQTSHFELFDNENYIPASFRR